MQKGATMLTTVLLWILYSFASPTTIDQALVVLRTTFPEWQENYVRGEFDCSNMSALVADYLNASGLKAEIKQGMSATTKKAHAWVVCQNNIIEATQLRITKPTNPTYAEYATPVTYSARVMKEQYDWRNSKYIKGKIREVRGGDDPVTMIGVSPNIIPPEPPAPETISVMDYGAVGNGITDDSVAIQTAADYCIANNKTLSIPSGTYLISYSAINAEYSRAYLDLSCNIECAGKLTWAVGASPNTTPHVRVEWQETPITIDPSTVGGLTKGSTQITGLFGYQGGTIVPYSNEELIKRVWAVDPFFKQEASIITGTSGQISPALMHTYDPDLLVYNPLLSGEGLVVHPYEPALIINGLSLEVTGTPTQAVSLLQNYKDYVTYNDLHLVQVTPPTGPIDGSYGMVIRGCNVTVNDPIITGQISGGTDGYGIMCGRTANLAINNPTITNCDSHAITGGGDKELHVTGGECATDAPTNPSVDSHWGSNMVIDGTEIDGGVSYAGENIIIRNATYVNCVRLLLIRADSPELTGTVLIEDCAITNAYYANTSTFMGFQYTSQASPIVYDFGRTLGAPTSVTINDIAISDTGGEDALFQVYGQSYPAASYENPIDAIGSRVHSNITWTGGTVYPGIV